MRKNVRRNVEPSSLTIPEQLLEILSGQERQVFEQISGRFEANPNIWDELAGRLGVTSVRIAEIHAGAILKLAKHLVNFPKGTAATDSPTRPDQENPGYQRRFPPRP
jgi:DNA-directed RNA polymerase sigma subunit (sigma70/sigma32)